MGKKMNHNDFINKCKERKDFNEYEVLSEYKSSRDNMKFKHLQCGRTFEMRANNFTSNKQKCPHCYSNKKLTHNEFEKRVFDLVGEEYTFIEKYVNNSTKIEVKHNICGNTYKVTPTDFQSGYRCPHCAGNKKLSFNDIKQKIKEISNEYEVLSECEVLFNNVHSVIKIKHLSCNTIFNKSYNNFRNGQECPVCSSKEFDSKAIREIKQILNENEIEYKTEVKLKGLVNPKTNKSLRIDFYIPHMNLFIEYDGKQHFKYSEKGIFTKEKFNEIKYRDLIKDKFFKNKKHKLLRINYLQDHKTIISRLISSTTIETTS